MKITLGKWQLDSMLPKQLEDSKVQIRLENKRSMSPA